VTPFHFYRLVAASGRAVIYVNKFALGGKRPKRFEVVIRGYAE
jgi:hypothetical protein